jgi:hypothetical protein
LALGINRLAVGTTELRKELGGTDQAGAGTGAQRSELSVGWSFSRFSCLATWCAGCAFCSGYSLRFGEVLRVSGTRVHGYALQRAERGSAA